MTTLESAKNIIDDQALAEEDLLDELENGDIPADIREARLSQLKQQAHHYSLMKDEGYGKYNEIKEEKAFLELTTSVKKCIVHFFHEDFRRSAIMDTHLEKLASKYFETKFAKINVDNATFFVTKLKIRVLPAVLCFMDGAIVDRVVGFEELGNTDSFLTQVLENRLAISGVIPGQAVKQTNKSVLGIQKARHDSDSSDED